MLGTKFHYGNCKQDYADLKHEYEKQKTKIATLEQTQRENDQIILDLNNEINELKAIHHYERHQLEVKLKDCDENHANLSQELSDLQQTYKDCLEKKRAATAKLLQLKHDMKHTEREHPGIQIHVVDKVPEIKEDSGEDSDNEKPKKRKRK